VSASDWTRFCSASPTGWWRLTKDSVRPWLAAASSPGSRTVRSVSPVLRALRGSGFPGVGCGAGAELRVGLVGGETRFADQLSPGSDWAESGLEIPRLTTAVI